jgi:hypothetical protein
MQDCTRLRRSFEETDSGLVGRVRLEEQRSRARRSAGLPGARVVAFVLFELLFEATEDGARDVVTAIPARALAARDEEKGRCVLDDDATDVRRVGDFDVTALFGDLESKCREGWNRCAETRGFVLPTPTLNRSFGSRSTATEVQ